MKIKVNEAVHDKTIKERSDHMKRIIGHVQAQLDGGATRGIIVNSKGTTIGKWSV